MLSEASPCKNMFRKKKVLEKFWQLRASGVVMLVLLSEKA
jgi:hypothetical protein